MITLYYLEVEDNSGNKLYKIGVTKGNVSWRYQELDESDYKIIFEIKLEDAYALEGTIKDRFIDKLAYRTRRNLQDNTAFLGGETELFNTDVLELDRYSLEDALNRVRSIKNISDIIESSRKNITGVKGAIFRSALTVAKYIQ